MQRMDESIRAHLFVDIDLAELPQRFLIMMRFTYADAVKASTECGAQGKGRILKDKQLACVERELARACAVDIRMLLARIDFLTARECRFSAA